MSFKCRRQTKSNFDTVRLPYERANERQNRMGGTQSKQFFRALKESNEPKAVELYRSSEELRSLDPNQPYGLLNRSVTPLHLSAKRGFPELFKLFMTNGGRANILDGRGQSVAHHICLTYNGTDSIVDQVRADMLLFLIALCTAPETVVLPRGQESRRPRHRQLLNLNGQDKALNTPLHLAAGSGLVRCVRVLLDHGAIANVTNIAGQTPFAAAESAGHMEVVKLLEPKMLFADTRETAMIIQKPIPLRLESYQGVERCDIELMKTELVKNTATVLDVPPPSAEKLLQHYSWSQQLLVDAWLDDPVKLCRDANVKLSMARQTSLAAEVVLMKQVSREEHLCEICGDLCLELVHADCNHAFCKTCWAEYLRSKVTEGKVVNIPCPGFGCNEFLSQALVTKLLPSELNDKFTHFDISAFVESNPATRWCPHPGCERAVHLKLVEQMSEESIDSTDSGSTASNTAPPRNVDCGVGHFFCWSCSEEAHDPCSCETWKAWKSKIESIENSDPESSAGILAQRASSEAWIAKNSKPCPKCKRPIQRSDGCNHMTCSKCEHDFCWVCLGRWAIHGSRTGGYYRCNRFTAVKRAQDHLDALKQQAQAESKRRNTRYFKHVYSRYCNHSQSMEFEKAFLCGMSEKMAVVIANALSLMQRVAPEDREGKFASEAIRELVKSRIVLRASYALSYYLESDSNRDGFVKLMAPMEKSTETLAELIARTHLSTPKDRIVLATIESRSARRQFLQKARSYNTRQIDVPEFEDPEDDDVISDHTDTDTDTDTDWDSSPPSTPPSPIPYRFNPNELQIIIEDSDNESYLSY